jgi:hypothetical protein
MAAKGFALSDKANRWDILITNGKEHVPEVPHIGEDLNLLELKSAEARVLISRGDDLRAQAQENTKKLREVVQEGEKIRARGAQSPGKIRDLQRAAGQVRIPAAPRGPAPAGFRGRHQGQEGESRSASGRLIRQAYPGRA